MVRKSIQQKQIFPAMSLCYLIVSLYYGFKCLGGFSQVNDLTLLKHAWMKLLEKKNFSEESVSVSSLQTDQLGGDGMVLSYHCTSQGSIRPASGIDMYASGPKHSMDKYVELAKKVLLNETMTPMLPEIYKVLYSNEERDPNLSKLGSEELAELVGLKEKILINKN